ncbi:MAG: hypothetical protein GX941_10620 [Candidatus Methanofastidiosa archaeon]|nr:hypothetical protein [Candidatus Methanofastidiosa archaeon]
MNLSVAKEICETCGYGKEEIERRSNYLSENDFRIEYCSCDKVGCKHYAAGYCGDVDAFLRDSPTTKTKGPRRKDAAYRRYMERVKKKRLRNIIENYGFTPHVGWVVESQRVDADRNLCGIYIKYPKSSKHRKYLKAKTSRKNRRNYLDLPTKGNKYRRVVDCWWELC